MGSGRTSRSHRRKSSNYKRRRRYSTSSYSSTNSSNSSVRYNRRRRVSERRRENKQKHRDATTNQSHAREHTSTIVPGGTPPQPNSALCSASMSNKSNTGNSQMLGDTPLAIHTAQLNKPQNTTTLPTTPTIGQQWHPNITATFNVIPEFDPSDDTQSVEWWIHKVNECAQIYGWDDRQTCHYALPKLSGLAKRWYQGLPSLLFTWEEWVVKLKAAFPSNENYGELLTKMLKCRCKFGQAFDNYYYEKLALLNKCEITGKKAVGCLIHGIDDKFVRMSASACMFETPENLFSYLRTVASSEMPAKTRQLATTSAMRIHKTPSTSTINEPSKGGETIRCFNCGELGHISVKCTKPIKKCNFCHRLGHIIKDCRKRLNSTMTSQAAEQTEVDSESTNRVMRITNATETVHSKYYKAVKVNGAERLAFIDLGSSCTMIRESDAKSLLDNWAQPVNLPNLRGFGNSVVKASGSVEATVEVDGVKSKTELLVIPDQYMQVPIIIGHTFTERPNVMIYKTNEELIFVEMAQGDNKEKTKEKLLTERDTIVESNCTSPISVKTGSAFTGSLFVSGGHRRILDQEFVIIPGLYSFDEGKGYLMITNIGKDDMEIKQNYALARGGAYEEVNDLYVGATDFSRTYEPLPLDKVKIGIALDELTLQKFHALLEEYRDCFALNLAELGETKLTEMHIKLLDDTPVVYNPYRMSLKEREQLQVIIEDLLQHGIIRESTSSYASPVILVNKKNGEKRLCIDYRALNRKTLKDKYPLPRIEDQLDSLGGNGYFTSLDLASGYYQVPMAEESKRLTAFVTPDGLFEYNRMPFGLANAPSVFQRTINTMLRGTSKRVALAYMDDLLIASKTVVEGMEKLAQVLKLLRNAKLTLKLEKCFFFQTHVDYLGYDISAEGIRPGSLKIKAVKEFPEPKNVHEVRQFIGLASYFRRFVESFSIIAKPLTILTKKNVPWTFGETQQRAFNELKDRLVSRPLLALYDPSASVEVHTDASKVGVGAILLQRHGDKLHPVAYYSRQTSPEEQRFHSYELETLALVVALQKFRVYLLGNSFKVVTDCNAIRSTMTKRDLIPRVARWWISMQEYDFSIEYRPGTKMAHVDALSRNPTVSQDRHEEQDVLEVLMVENDAAWLETVQSADPEIQRMVEILKDPESDNVVEIKNNFTVKNGKLYRMLKQDEKVELLWVVPKAVRWQILQMNHDKNGHFGFDKTYDRIKRVYWFKGMRKFIKKYCQSCLQCAYNKVPAGPKEGMLHPIEKVSKPFDTLHADHCGPFPMSKKKNQYVLAIIDSFTKYIFLKPVKDCRSKTTIQVLEEYFSLFGVPRRIITDRGTSFTSQEFKRYISEKGTSHILNAVATPRANGQIERYNRTFVEALKCENYGKPDNEWDLAIPKVQWSLNNTLNKGTGKTPSEALFGVALTGSCDGLTNSLVSDANKTNEISQVRESVQNHILIDQQKQKIRFDKTRKEAKSYKIGDLVRVERDINSAPGESRKLVKKISGPYRVTKVLSNDRYEVQDTPVTRKEGRGAYTGVYPVDKIHPWLVFTNDLATSDSD